MAELHVSFVNRRESGIPDNASAGLNARRASGAFDGLPANVVRPARLAPIVEGEIIPRLMLLHRAAPAQDLPLADVSCLGSRRLTDEFARRSLAGDIDQLLDLTDPMLKSGVSLGSLYGDLIVPAARRLEDWWCEDRCCDVEVTLGLALMRQAVHELGLMAAPAAPNGRAVFLTSRTEPRRGLGLSILEESFHQAGWRASSHAGAPPAQMLHHVQTTRCDLVSLSISRDDSLEATPGLIAALRAASRNRAVAVMLNGSAFQERPGLHAELGADAAASDGREAVLRAEDAVWRLASSA